MGLLRAGVSVADDDSLMDAGALDSLRLMELVTHLERQYGFSVAPDDLVPENFDSLDAIARFVSTRRAAASHAVDTR